MTRLGDLDLAWNRVIRKNWDAYQKRKALSEMRWRLRQSPSLCRTLCGGVENRTRVQREFYLCRFSLPSKAVAWLSHPLTPEERASWPGGGPSA